MKAPAKPEHQPTEEGEKPDPEKPQPAAHHAKPEPKPSSKHVFVAVEALSWRPHLLPCGTEVSEILPKDVIETCLADGRLTRQAPE